MNYLGRWLLASALVWSIFQISAFSQEYPSRLVRVVVPYPAGGGTDIMARAIAERLSRAWGQPVTVENKLGGGTTIAAEAIANSAADGYTLFVTADLTITGNPFTYKKLSYDPLKDFAPITNLAWGQQMVVVHSSVAANTMKELVALIKSKPGELNYGSFGAGSQTDLVFEGLGTLYGARLTNVPYKGLVPALQAAAAGEVQLTLAGVPFARGFVQSGQLKAIAMAAAERSPLAPDIPTLREAGFPNIDLRTWIALFAPGGTPGQIIKKIHADVAAIYTDRDFVEKQILQKGFGSAINASPEEFAAYIRSDMVYKEQLLKNAGIRAQ